MSRIKPPRETYNSVGDSTVRRAITAACLSLCLIFLGAWMKSPDKSIGITTEILGGSNLIIQSGSIEIESIDEPAAVTYLKCGIVDPKSTEILLLHGTAFTKENWKDSRIMQKFCSIEIHNRPTSVIALDLAVTADGPRLYEVFTALKHLKLITGNQLIIVTPSASGKSILSLSSLYYNYRNSTDEKEKDQAAFLPTLLKAWIPIASYAVARETHSLTSFKDCKIPILALYGKEDDAGKGVSQKLAEFAGAEMIEIQGGHACYLDSPDDFTRSVIKFADQL